MLVLSRKRGEALLIGENVVVKVLGVEGEVVKLGIEAPREVAIYRQEVYQQIRESNREAAQSRWHAGELLDQWREWAENQREKGKS